jgi:uncharacterized membrane-anchored protein YhcB (DUF1043 family)
MANQTNVSDVKNKAQETGSKLADQARDVAGNVADKARDVASNLADKARSAASAAGQQAEHLTSSAGSGLRSLGESVREHAPSSGYLGSAAQSVASGLESGGRYLQDQGLSGMGEDLTNLIRRNPIPALFVGIGLGFLLARLTRS